MSDPYGSHIFVLADVCSYIYPKTAIELGMGPYSTQFLLKVVGEKLISIETESEEWFKRISVMCKSNKWTSVFDRERTELEIIQGLKADLVLVDGASAMRVPVCSYAQTIADTVICHDAEYHAYVKAPFCQYVKVIDEKPYTAVYSTNTGLIEYLKERHTCES